MKKLVLILLTISFFSCNNEKQPTILEESSIHAYKFSKDLWVFDDNKTGKVLLTICSDNQDIFEQFNQNTLSINLIPSVTQNNVLGKMPKDDESKASTPDISIEIKDVSIPPNSKGFSLNNSSSRLKSLSEWVVYEYYSTGCYGVDVINKSDGDKTVRIGVLWTGNQWFYENILVADLQYKWDQCGVDLTGTVYYKMRVRVDGDGQHDVNFLYYAQ
ncbi:MAG: hypothetical protein WC865_03165 [Bacteroidales bacterium]